MKKTITYFFEALLRTLGHLFDDLWELIDPNKHRLQGAFGSSRKILSRRKRGFNLIGKSISPELSRQGVLINGETGSFKTAGAVMRSVLTVEGSQIIHDPSRELHMKTSGALKERGYRILQLDFTNPNQSLRFNPMQRCRSKSEIVQLATLLVMINDTESSNDTSFWNQSAIQVLVVLISILKKQEDKYQTLYNVAYLIDLMQAKSESHLVDKLFAQYADQQLFVSYSSIISNSENTLSSILSTCAVAVQIFKLDDDIARITSRDNIGDFRTIRQELTALYLHSSTAKMRYYSKISSIFLQQYFESFFSELPNKDDLDVYYHLDETPVLSISGLDIIASNIRKYRGALMLICQDAHAQLESKYGKRSEAILTNMRTKVFYSANLDTATKLERSLGRYEFVDKQDGNRLKSRAVLNADEIMALPSNRALITVSGMRAMLAKVTPYFKVGKLRDLTSLPPIPTEGANWTDKDEALPLIPLHEMFPDEDNEV